MTPAPQRRVPWRLKYRPVTFDQFADQDEIKKLLAAIIVKNQPENLLFSGPPGYGKSVMARLFAQEYFRARGALDEKGNPPVWAYKLVELTSETANVQTVADLVRFTQYLMPFEAEQQGVFKVLILDEIDRFSGKAMEDLRSLLEGQTAWAGKSMVIATTNFPEKLPEAVRSRFLDVPFPKPPTEAIATRLKEIAAAEGCKVSADDIEDIADEADGSLRDGIVKLQNKCMMSEGEFALGTLKSLEEVEREERGLLEMWRMPLRVPSDEELRALVAIVKRRSGVMEPSKYLYAGIRYTPDAYFELLKEKAARKGDLADTLLSTRAVKEVVPTGALGRFVEIARPAPPPGPLIAAPEEEVAPPPVPPPPTTAAAVERQIEERAKDIVEYIRLGWAREKAIEEVRSASTLGPKSWAGVLQRVDEIEAAAAPPMPAPRLVVLYETKEELIEAARERGATHMEFILGENHFYRPSPTEPGKIERTDAVYYNGAYRPSWMWWPVLRMPDTAVPIVAPAPPAVPAGIPPIVLSLPAKPPDRPEPLPIQQALRPDQEAGVMAALEKRRGIIVMPTGAGKTLVLLALWERAGFPKTLVIVPQIALLGDWADRRLAEVGVPKKWVGVWFGEEKREGEKITVATYASATLDPDILRDYDLILLDEVHHAAASDTMAQLLPIIKEKPFVIGATATPPEAPEVLAELPIIYRVTIPEAMEARAMAPLLIRPVPVDLTDEEGEAYRKATSIVTGAVRMFGPPRGWRRFLAPDNPRMPQAKGALRALSARRKILSEAEAKFRELVKIVQDHPSERVMVFSESVASIERACATLGNVDITCRTITAKTPRADRVEALKDWGVKFQVLASVRTMEEGIDVPEARIAVMLASGRSERQITQRVGRILRPAPSKQAVLYVIYARLTTDEAVLSSVKQITGAVVEGEVPEALEVKKELEEIEEPEEVPEAPVTPGEAAEAVSVYGPVAAALSGYAGRMVSVEEVKAVADEYDDVDEFQAAITEKFVPAGRELSVEDAAMLRGAFEQDRGIRLPPPPKAPPAEVPFEQPAAFGNFEVRATGRRAWQVWDTLSNDWSQGVPPDVDGPPISNPITPSLQEANAIALTLAEYREKRFKTDPNAPSMYEAAGTRNGYTVYRLAGVEIPEAGAVEMPPPPRLFGPAPTAPAPPPPPAEVEIVPVVVTKRPALKPVSGNYAVLPAGPVFLVQDLLTGRTVGVERDEGVAMQRARDLAATREQEFTDPAKQRMVVEDGKTEDGRIIYRYGRR